MDLTAIKHQIETEIKNNAVVLYMKGNKDQPMCGFSAQVIQILNHLKVEYITRNVLEDDALRQGIKEYSDWPTIPQLYIHGEFIGGCDITTALFQNGELEKKLNPAT